MDPRSHLNILEGGESSLQEINRSKPIVKNRVETAIEAAVVKMAFDYPAFGQLRASNELRKLGFLFLLAVFAAFGSGMTWKFLTSA